MKRCSACGEVKDATAFALRSRDSGALQSKCKLCARNYAAEWYSLNRREICKRRVARYKRSAADVSESSQRMPSQDSGKGGKPGAEDA